MSLAAPLAALALAAALLSGCGSSSGGSTSTGSAPPAKQEGGAKAPVGASATSCALDAGGATGLRATGVSCGRAQKLALAWGRLPACSADPGASHSACSVRGYRCIATSTARGLSVGCARPGRSIAFTVKRN